MLERDTEEVRRHRFLLAGEWRAAHTFALSLQDGVQEEELKTFDIFVIKIRAHQGVGKCIPER